MYRLPFMDLLPPISLSITAIRKTEHNSGSYPSPASPGYTHQEIQYMVP